MLEYISRSAFLSNDPLPNVWLGISVEDKKSMLERAPILCKTPAAVKWLSIEPLIGSMAFESFSTFFYSGYLDPPQDDVINWVVVGGESGSGARPMHPDWARHIRDECLIANVPFFFKQWGEWLPVGPIYSDDDTTEHLAALDTDDGSFDGDDPRECHVTSTGYLTRARFDGQPSPGTWAMRRVGKKAAGRLLDGREWNEYPNIALGGA